MRESKVERHLTVQVRAHGGTTKKLKNINDTDQLVIWQGLSDWSNGKREQQPARIHFVECKAPGKKPRPGQEREHVRLQKLGCVVLVLDTIEKVDAYIERNK